MLERLVTVYRRVTDMTKMEQSMAWTPSCVRKPFATHAIPSSRS